MSETSLEINDFDFQILSHIKNPTHYEEHFNGVDIMQYAASDLIPKGLVAKGRMGEWYLTDKGRELLQKGNK